MDSTDRDSVPKSEFPFTRFTQLILVARSRSLPSINIDFIETFLKRVQQRNDFKSRKKAQKRNLFQLEISIVLASYLKKTFKLSIDLSLCLSLSSLFFPKFLSPQFHRFWIRIVSIIVFTSSISRSRKFFAFNHNRPNKHRSFLYIYAIHSPTIFTNTNYTIISFHHFLHTRTRPNCESLWGKEDEKKINK